MYVDGVSFHATAWTGVENVSPPWGRSSEAARAASASEQSP
jgi:hypothetical protein